MSQLSSKKLKIIVIGYIIRGPIAGRVWADLHYMLGLKAMGHDVYFFEDSGDYPNCCYDFSKNIATNDPSYGINIADKMFKNFQLDNHWSYYDAHTNKWFGNLGEKMLEVAKDCDLIISFVRLHKIRSWFDVVPVKLLIDKDPFFTQLSNLNNSEARIETSKYNRFFTFHENINLEMSILPNDGIAWQITRHPIFLDLWPCVPPKDNGCFTTLMQWDSYRYEQYKGKSYGMKSESFKVIMEMPRRTNFLFELVVGGNAPRQLLKESGWIIRSPLQESIDIWKYQNYIQNSKAEFTIAKHGYVVSNSGWFSERSASYLASGRPVITQQTGFSEWLPTGEGVLAFENMDQAIAAIEDVNARYEFHCKRARELAEVYFDYRKILSDLLNRSMCTS